MTCAFPALATTFTTADGAVACGSAEAADDSADAPTAPLEDRFVPVVDAPAIRADATTADVVGGEPQTDPAALVAVLTADARVMKISPAPRSATLMSAPRAAGLSSCALTRCNLASVNGLSGKRAVRLRHTTHGSRIGARAHAIDTNG